MKLVKSWCFALAAVWAACAVAQAQTSPFPTKPSTKAPAVCSNCGVVSTVTPKKTKGRASYVNTIGVPAGTDSETPRAPTKNIGDKTEKTDRYPSTSASGVTTTRVPTVVSATGSTIVGREAEKRMKKKDVYEIVVRMEDGSSRVLVKEVRPAIQPGDRVKVIGEDLFVRQN